MDTNEFNSKENTPVTPLPKLITSPSLVLNGANVTLSLIPVFGKTSDSPGSCCNLFKSQQAATISVKYSRRFKSYKLNQYNYSLFDSTLEMLAQCSEDLVNGKSHAKIFDKYRFHVPGYKAPPQTPYETNNVKDVTKESLLKVDEVLSPDESNIKNFISNGEDNINILLRAAEVLSPHRCTNLPRDYKITLNSEGTEPTLSSTIDNSINQITFNHQNSNNCEDSNALTSYIPSDENTQSTTRNENHIRYTTRFSSSNGHVSIATRSHIRNTALSSATYEQGIPSMRRKNKKSSKEEYPKETLVKTSKKRSADIFEEPEVLQNTTSTLDFDNLPAGFKITFYSSSNFGQNLPKKRKKGNKRGHSNKKTN